MDDHDIWISYLLVEEVLLLDAATAAGLSFVVVELNEFRLPSSEIVLSLSPRDDSFLDPLFPMIIIDQSKAQNIYERYTIRYYSLLYMFFLLFVQKS